MAPAPQIRQALSGIFGPCARVADRPRRAGTEGGSARRARGGGLRTATLVLVAISLVAYVLAIWAMSTKPS